MAGATARRVLVLTEQTSNDRKTLAVVRSLAAAGYSVAVAGDTPLTSAFWSRHTSERVRCPSPISEPERYDRWLLAEAKRRRPDVLIPVSDYTTLVVSRLAPQLRASTRFAVPPLDGFLVAHDKLAVQRLAGELGIASPRTHCPRSRSELEEIAQAISYPAVFKLRKGAGAIGLAFPNDARALLAEYDALGGYGDEIYTAEDPLVQEFVPGMIHDVCAVFAHGEPHAVLTQVRTLMHPARGGVGIHNHTTNNTELATQAVTLLRALDWHGPAMVEFKHDARDGRYRLIEINPRLWGTLDLCIHAGMHVPVLLAELALNDHLEPETGYRVDASYRWALPYAFKGLMSGLGWRNSWRLLRPERGSGSEIRLSDPLPELAKLCDVLYRGWQQLRGVGTVKRDLETAVMNG